jgi:hypothetical protein
MSFECVARGSDKIENGFAKLDDTRVQFMLIKFPIGSGTFKRNKFVYVHFVGPQCGAVKRGKWNAELGNALKLFQTSAGIEVTSRDALSFETLVTQLKKVFVADDGTFSLQKIQDEFNRRVAEESSKAASGSEEAASPTRNRKLAVALGLTKDSVLKAIREDMGPLNWAVFECDPKEAALKLVEGGSNGIFELVEFLPEEKVLFGIFRVAFGTGRFRRTKHIMFQWIGDKVGPVARGKANALFSQMEAALAPCNASVRFVGASDLEPEAILAKVKSAFVVDTIELPTADGKLKKASFSKEEYIQSLLEEQEKQREFYNEAPAPTQGSGKTTETYPVDSTLSQLHQNEGGLVWAIFQCK